MAHANPIQIQKFLKGVDYPASREQLIENAKRLGADDNICASLGQLPDEDFQTPADVSQAFKGPSSDDVGGREPASASGEAQFLVQVTEDSLAEMELCMVALDNAGSDDVRNLARVIINEHGKLGQQIETLAQRMRVQFPKKIRAEHVAMINHMRGIKGDEFDRKFIEQSLRYHENDLKVFEHYAAQKDGREVARLAEAGARLFGKHLKMIREVALKIRS